jgi:hypothetical protein
MLHQMGGNRYPVASEETAYAVSEDMVTLIVVAMLTSMTIILSGAPALARNALAALF